MKKQTLFITFTFNESLWFKSYRGSKSALISMDVAVWNLISITYLSEVRLDRSLITVPTQELRTPIPFYAVLDVSGLKKLRL